MLALRNEEETCLIEKILKLKNIVDTEKTITNLVNELSNTEKLRQV